ARFYLFLLLSTVVLTTAAPVEEKREVGLAASALTPIISIYAAMSQFFGNFLAMVPIIGPMANGVLSSMNPANILNALNAFAGTAPVADGLRALTGGQQDGLGNLIGVQPTQ
ncbi:hypothetical protein PMAYCL1PPCAC_09109, partial [Pristionchus mayeri]